jgi:transposase
LTPTSAPSRRSLTPAKRVVIPPEANHRLPGCLDRDLYKVRHLIENLFAKLELFRAIATRYEKTTRTFNAGNHLAAAI